jgi:hypothetical protein
MANNEPIKNNLNLVTSLNNFSNEQYKYNRKKILLPRYRKELQENITKLQENVNSKKALLNSTEPLYRQVKQLANITNDNMPILESSNNNEILHMPSVIPELTMENEIAENQNTTKVKTHRRKERTKKIKLKGAINSIVRKYFNDPNYKTKELNNMLHSQFKPKFTKKNIYNNAKLYSEALKNPKPYNSDVLSRLSPYLQYMFQYISMELPFDNIKNVVGPYYLTILQLGNKNFFLFGEFHNLDSNFYGKMFNPKSTVAFDGFLKSLLVKYQKYNFDFYLEKSLYQSGAWTKHPQHNRNANHKILTFNITSIINLLSSTFLDCLRFYDKSQCSYTNLRAHNSNLRDYYEDKIDLINSQHLINPTQSIDELKQYNVLVNSLLDYKELIYGKQSYSRLNKIEKQTKDTVDPKYLPILDEHFEEIFSNNELNYNTITIKYASIMDYYTLLRMLRKFDKPKHVSFGFQQHQPLQKYWPQHNIIGYFGSAHTELMKKALLKLGAVIRYSSQESPVLSISNIALSYFKLDDSTKALFDELITSSQ